MRLVDLSPRWVKHHGEGRVIGIEFQCPCPKCVGGEDWHPIRVGFANPPDGGPRSDAWSLHWQRVGETFETLTLSPSIDASKAGHWHGFVTNGEVR